MAKSSLSISASRVLLGLGVVGITTGAFAQNISENLTQGKDGVTDTSSKENVIVKVTDSQNTIGKIDNLLSKNDKIHH